MERYWGRSAGVRRAARARTAEMVSGFFPWATAERLAVAADYLSWAFNLDDLGDETSVGQRPERLLQLFEEFERACQGTLDEASASPAARALADVARRLRAIASTAEFDRFYVGNQAYWGAMLWEANNRANGHVPDEEAFLLLRPAAGAAPSIFALIEPMEGIQIPEETRESVLFKDLERLAGGIVCWINDVLSFEKECEHGDAHNLVLVYETHRNLARRDALFEAVAFSNRQVAEFEARVRSLPESDEPQARALRHYARVLGSMVRVTLDWTLDSARYGGASAPASQQRIAVR
jgi:hypothetical protein